MEHFKHKKVKTVNSTTSFKNHHGRATNECFISTRSHLPSMLFSSKSQTS